MILENMKTLKKMASVLIEENMFITGTIANIVVRRKKNAVNKMMKMIGK